MKKNIIRYILLFVTGGIICLLLHFIGIHTINKQEESLFIKGLKKQNINNVIGANIYLDEDQNYDYITYDLDFIFGKYFFENNNQINLEIGDSVSKVPNELVLKIFRKDESGQYKYIGTSK